MKNKLVKVVQFVATAIILSIVVLGFWAVSSIALAGLAFAIANMVYAAVEGQTIPDIQHAALLSIGLSSSVVVVGSIGSFIYQRVRTKLYLKKLRKAQQ